MSPTSNSKSLAKIAESTTVLINSLQLWDRNPRSIKGDRFNELKARLKRQGQIKPLLVAKDGKTVIGGNMRLRAMQELGISEVWVSQTEAQTDKEIFDLALTDNEEFGYYEQEQVAELALELGLSPLELKSYALSLGEPTTLDLVLDKFQPTPEEDEVPEVDEENTYSELGQVYQLGKHRLMCGSATDMDNVTALMAGSKADMVLTDPPYNTGMSGATQGKGRLWAGDRSESSQKGSTWLSHMFDDDYTDEEFEQLLTDMLASAYAVTKAEAAFYVCIDWRKVADIKQAVEQLMPVSNVIVWDKMVHGLGSDYKYTYELIVVGKKGRPDINNRIGRDYQDVWHVQHTMGRNEDHATAKPLELCMKPIKHASKQDDIVLDLFGGSGSTLIAAEMTNRTCYMMELDPKYCDVIRKRYAKHIGEEEAWQEATPAVNQLQPAS